MRIRKEAELEWAIQKYDVMAKGCQYYSKIRNMFHEARGEEDYDKNFQCIGRDREFSLFEESLS
ncbi:hypothetical protein [Fictibacillus sp. NRS-1165]|uniref:hypothetical protein n=1 Tax=Fictibacillus sp. NRS-1165 TaxID=3144463 RepID=UPI003D1EE839